MIGTAALLGLWYFGFLVVGLTAFGELTFGPDNSLLTGLARQLGGYAEE